jgi:hypothetical protein
MVWILRRRIRGHARTRSFADKRTGTGQAFRSAANAQAECGADLALAGGRLLWQRRYYDFNVWSEAKRIQKLRYMHRNPVKRGLVRNPEDWAWSSFRHYVSGFEGVVEIESQWTARKREQMGEVGIGSQNPRPVSAQNADTRTGHPRDLR